MSLRLVPGMKTRGRATAIALAVAVGFAAKAFAAGPAVSIELNKLETQGTSCRSFLVIQNDSDTALQNLKLDLIIFQTDNVIARRFAIDLAPLKAKKKSVKLFDLDGLACDKIGSMLINDVVECKADQGPLEDCLAGITVKSLSNVQLMK